MLTVPSSHPPPALDRFWSVSSPFYIPWTLPAPKSEQARKGGTWPLISVSWGWADHSWTLFCSFPFAYPNFPWKVSIKLALSLPKHIKEKRFSLILQCLWIWVWNILSIALVFLLNSLPYLVWICFYLRELTEEKPNLGFSERRGW